MLTPMSLLENIAINLGLVLSLTNDGELLMWDSNNEAVVAASLMSRGSRDRGRKAMVTFDAAHVMKALEEHGEAGVRQLFMASAVAAFDGFTPTPMVGAEWRDLTGQWRYYNGSSWVIMFK